MWDYLRYMPIRIESALMWDRLSYISFLSFTSGLKQSFNNIGTLQFPLSQAGSFFLPFASGASRSVDIVDNMEDEKLVSVSAMPSYENISLEELRWQEYQTKKTDCTFVCKFCNNAGSFAPMPSLLSSSTADTPSSSSEPLSSSYDLHSKVISETRFSSSKQNHLQFVPVLSSGFSSSNDGATSVCGPLQPFFGLNTQNKSVSGLDWPQQPLQLSVTSITGPITTVEPSLPVAGAVDQNISVQMPPIHATPENSFVAPLGTAFKYSNIPSHSSARPLGISSLPDTDKCSQTRSISLLPSKQVFQKTVIRMQARRHASHKKEGPRVSFMNDYDRVDSTELDAMQRHSSCIAPWLEKDGENQAALFSLQGASRDNAMRVL